MKEIYFAPVSLNVYSAPATLIQVYMRTEGGRRGHCWMRFHNKSEKGQWLLIDRSQLTKFPIMTLANPSGAQFSKGKESPIWYVSLL